MARAWTSDEAMRIIINNLGPETGAGTIRIGLWIG